MTPTIDPGWGAGFHLHGGVGPTSVDLDDLGRMTRALAAAADRLEAASAALREAALLALADATIRPDLAAAAHRAIEAARRGAASPGACATDVRDLVRRIRAAIVTYRDADGASARVLRALVPAVAGAWGEAPLAALVVGGGALAGAAAILGLVAAGAPARSLVLRRPDPVLAALVTRAHAPGATLVEAGADGRATWAVEAVAAFLRGLEPGLRIPVLRAPARATARDLACGLPPAPRPALLVRTDPPWLPAPRSTAGVLAVLAEAQGAGTPPGTVTIQRLTRPDGSRAWIVEVPGTQSWRPNARTPTDLTTNLREVAGLPDDMTAGALQAMRAAGIARGEPVLVVGHSQGGMTAVNVAARAAPAFTVRAVLTAGAPDVPAVPPPGVEVRAYRHTEDLVPQLDGTADVGGPHVTVVTRTLATTGGPAHPDVAQAHALDRYVQTAREADVALAGSPALRGYDAAQAQVLGPAGTTSTAMQFQLVREPVRADRPAPASRTGAGAGAGAGR